MENTALTGPFVALTAFLLLTFTVPNIANAQEGEGADEGQTLCYLGTVRYLACLNLLCAHDPSYETCESREVMQMMLEWDLDCVGEMWNMSSAMLDSSCEVMLEYPGAPDDAATRIPLAEQPAGPPPAVSPYADNPSEEAQVNLRLLYDSSVYYYDADMTNAMGDILPSQFPDTVGPTPSVVPCGAPYQSSADDWSPNSWEALNFAMGDPQYYSYQYDSSGTGVGSTFTATAFGDLDCDGVLSTFMRIGEVTDGNEIQGGAGLLIEQPDE